MDLETRIKWVVARLTGRPEAQDVTLEEFDSENFNPEHFHSFEETDPGLSCVWRDERFHKCAL